MSKKLRGNNLDFSTSKFTSKKVRGYNVDFSTSEVMSKKVGGNNLNFSTSEITSKKVRGNNVDLSTTDITLKKYVEMTWKYGGIWSLTYRRNIHVESTSCACCVNLAVFFQPPLRSDFIATMSSLAINLIVN